MQNDTTSQFLLDAGAYLFTALPNAKHNAEPEGFKNSFQSLEELDQWQEQHPRYKDGNIGVDLSKSPLVVLDIDKHDADGLVSLTNYLTAIGIEPQQVVNESYAETTPSGGLHIVYKWPSDKPKPMRAVGVLDGVDLLTDGGVIVAPSKIDSNEYKAIKTDNGDAHTIEKAPNWLLGLLSAGDKETTAKHYKTAKTTPAERWGMVVDGFQLGQRNEQATSFIGGLFESQVEPSKAKEKMGKLGRLSAN